MLGTVNGYVKLSLGDGRFAFAKASDLEPGGTPAGSDRARGRDGARAAGGRDPAAAAGDARHAHARARRGDDDASLLDAYIFVGSRKVFYRSNRNGADPKRMDFDADLPLRPGVNVVTHRGPREPRHDARTARSSCGATGRTASCLPTPKTEDELSETSDDE